MSLTPFDKTMAAFDAANAEDPNVQASEGESIPRELLYSQRMTRTLASFNPEASELVQLAVHAQHIQRWKSPRSDYPLGRKGYLKWRSELGRFHAETAGALMAENGYSEDDVERVKVILRKEKLLKDPDVQILEDVACLVFLTYYFEPFAASHEDAKIISVLRKTWRKMSEAGHAAALKLDLSPESAALIEKALSE